MSYSVRVVDATHRADLFVEIETENELVAEVYAEAGTVRVAFVDASGQILRTADKEELLDALERAEKALDEIGLASKRAES